MARRQGVELQYKAGKQMSLRRCGVRQVINTMGAGYTRDRETRTIPSKVLFQNAWAYTYAHCHVYRHVVDRDSFILNCTAW